MEPLQPDAITTDFVVTDWLSRKKISMAVLRLDKIHTVISGNKWFKLKYYIQEALEQKKKHIVTFGGAYSNHIIATAAACKIYGLECTGIIRGEEPAIFSPTLEQAKKTGMELVFVSREHFSEKRIPAFLQCDDNYIINEGGYGATGARGAATILSSLPATGFTHICCAAGTGTMMAGLVNASAGQQSVYGISVLKNNVGLESAVRALLVDPRNNFSLIHDYHFGGYAKFKPQLFDFMNDFYKQTGVPTDFVYTGKLFFGIMDLIEKDEFPAGSKLVVIHSGGLQGNISLRKGTLIF